MASISYFDIKVYLNENRHFQFNTSVDIGNELEQCSHYTIQWTSIVCTAETKQRMKYFSDFLLLLLLRTGYSIHLNGAREERTENKTKIEK